MRDTRIPTAVKVDFTKKKRKIVTADDYHDILSRKGDHYMKIIDEYEK